MSSEKCGTARGGSGRIRASEQEAKAPDFGDRLGQMDVLRKRSRLQTLPMSWLNGMHYGKMLVSATALLSFHVQNRVVLALCCMRG